VKSKFLCEECGKPVSFDAEICPWCHRKFSAVRCPRCGLVDQPVRFLDGCPSCGYLKTREPGKARIVRRKKKKKYAVPIIVYRIAGLFIFILIVVLIFLYVRSL
jgi:predicted amidophosphoribosyltransferase